MKVLKLISCLGLLACMLAGCGTGTTAETTAADTTVADTTEEVIPMTEIDNGLAQSKSYYTNKLCDGTADPFILEHDGTYYLYCTGGSKFYVRTSKDLIHWTKKDTPILISALLALTFSCLFTWVPGLTEVSGGLAIVICTVAAAAFCAWKFPVREEGEA